MEEKSKYDVNTAFTFGDAFPLVSICIPTFNGAEFMSEALDSCRNQDYPNLELVISDDASTDSTMHIVRQQTKNFPFPVTVFDHLPSGIGANWNYCIEHAKGKYVKFLFQDDQLEPTCISELVTLIQSQPNVALAGSKRNILANRELSENENWLKSYGDLQKNLVLNEQGVYMLSKKDFNYLFFYHGPLNKIGEPSTVLLNKECLLASGFFREDLNQVLDLEYWWRLMEKYTLLISPKHLSSFRLHVNQATNKNRYNYLREYFAVKFLILSKYIWKMPTGDFQKVVSKEFSLFKKSVKYKINTFWKVRF
jgi:glycosyltransferase involved in cell wall biosynthesis